MISLLANTKKACLAFLAVISAAGLHQAVGANFTIEDQTLAGDATTVTVPIKVSDFANVGAIQFTISWDPAVLTYASLGDFNNSGTYDPDEEEFLPETDLIGFKRSKFNLDFVGDGNLNIVWDHANAIDAVIADDETIFSITFDVIGGDGSSSAVAFTDVPTPRKLATFSSGVPNPEFVSQNGTIQIGTPIDTTPPVITLTGDASLTIEAGTTYTDAGATATDDVDDPVAVTKTGAVNAAVPGTYTLTYSASDAAGNAAAEVTRTVVVEDTTAPVITLSGELNQGGANFMDQEAGVAFVEPGATATDNVDGPVTVTTLGTVDENTPDTYILTYTAIDAAGNEATSLTRTVVVADRIAPVITLLGAAEMDVLFSADFTDPGSTVSDSFENGLTSTVTGEVDTSIPGTYTLTYNVSDSAGNAAAAVQRTVHVVDQQGPVITLNGDASVNHEAGTVYEDAGATATDNVDTTVTIDTAGDVNADVPGTYTLTYTASDSEGNEATPVTRTVVVADTTPPVITLVGDAIVDLNEGTLYTDAGATATDSFDTSVTVVDSGEVDETTPGTYTLTYNATDAAGNAATTVTRTVLVIDTVTFIIQDQLLAGDASVTVPIKVSSFANVGGMQFTLTWDPNVLKFSSLGDFNHSAENSELLAFGQSNFNLAEASNGKLPVLYEHPGSSDGSVEDNETIFSVTFDVLGELGSSTAIIFGDDPTPSKMGSFDAAVAPVFLSQDGNISLGEDTVAPVITLVGDSSVNHEAGTTYDDAGAVASDNSGESMTVTTTGIVNGNPPGSYTLTYNASDSAGNAATAVTRTVLVADTIAPEITLEGEPVMTVAVGGGFTDPGSTVSDIFEDGLTATVTGDVNDTISGVYTLNYNVSDSAGNAAVQVTRTVNVTDQTAPVITLSGPLNQGGANFMDQEAGVAFVEPGAIATDNVDGTVTVTTTGSVDVSTPGTYTLTYTAIDAAGNEATPATRTVVVADTIAPVITLLGSAEMDVLFNAPFTDPGSTVSDSFESGLTATATGTVNTAEVGTYTLNYNVSDSAGNAAAEVQRTVHVVDQQGPVISLNGTATVNHEATTAYTDAGASATDNVDATVIVTTSGEVNVNVPDTYILTYNATDSEGNPATPVIRTVVVVDLASPVIALTGQNPLNHEAGVAYLDAGATATDNVDSVVTVTTTGTVDINSIGSNTLTYDASDVAGNAATPVTRTVLVADNTPPVVTLLGDDVMTVLLESAFVDPGATVQDSFDTGLLASVVGSVDTSTLGTYTLTYSASDNSGNAAQEVTRTVLVVDDTTPPVITLLGAPFSLHEAGTPFTDPGAEGSDNRDGNITSSIQKSGNVNVQAIGDYELKYDLVDAAGNEAQQKTRTVQVNDSIAPEISLAGESSLKHEAGSEYTDQGSIVTDSFENGLIAEVTGSVDSSKLGTYTLTFNATDSSDNSAAAVTRTVSVVDTTPPVIALLGEATLTLAVGDTFTDPGSSVSDSFEEGLTATVAGTVDTSKPGSYQLTYSAQDSSQNAASEVLRTVIVEDQTAPIITLNGDVDVIHEAGLTYVDAGVTVTDNVDTTVDVTITGIVDENSLGTYTLTYSASDAAGNPATAVTREVSVTDTIAPVVALLGESEITHIIGTSYSDSGAEVVDSFETDLTAELTGDVNVEELGVYTLSYSAKDSSGNEATPVERKVTVTDGLEVTQITSTSTQISENGGQSDITVYLSQPALAESTLLSVIATPASRVKVPATFPVFGGLEKIEFSIEGLDDSDSNGDELVSIQLKTAYRDLGEPIELTIQDDDLEAPVIGTVSDGLISGATVFFDRNANRVLDADEPSTQTDNRGAYQLDLPASLYDINGDDAVDSADGVIVARGGIDTATGLTLETPLLAPPSATVINPITTLVSNMIENDSSLDADNAAALVQSSLGIGGVDVLNFDMFEEAGNENPAATEVIKAAAKVQDTIVQAGSFISGASTISKTASYSLISEILVKKIKEQQPIELNDVATLESVVEEAAVKAQVVIAPESIKGAAAIISDSNQLKQLAVDAAESVAKAAQEISRVQGHAQSESQSDLADLGAGIQSLEALEIKYEAENLEKLVEETAVGPVSGVDERVGTFAFSSANYEVNESGEAVTKIKITREEGNLGVVDLVVTPQGQTASSDEDFVATSIEVRFDDQEITKTLSLVGVLIDDQVSDAGESFTLQLALKEQGDSPAKIGSIAEANIQIIDNDFAGTFQFKVVSNTFSEAETGEQYLVVERFGGDSGEVTLELREESLAGGATSGGDYTIEQTSVSFGDGVLQRKVSVNLIDDELLEMDESFRLTLLLPTGDTSGALIGSNAATEILIQSDEVDLPPVISSIADIQTQEDGTEVMTSFSVGDDYTPLDRLRITVSSANRSIIPGQNLRLTPGGDAGEWELRILPLTNTYGVVPLSVRVSDGSNVTTTEFSVIIGGQNDAPSISEIPSMIDAVGTQVVIPFQLSDIDDQPEDLLVYFDTSQVDYVAARHVDVKGAGMQRELVINPTGLATGTGFFKLIVVDSDGARFSRAFTVHFGGEFPAPVVPQLGIARDGSGGLILNWEGDALLYISRDLSGGFEPIADAVSPYRVDTLGNAFFKLGLKP